MIRSFLFKSILMFSLVLIGMCSFSQEITKDSIQGLWKTCGAFEIDEKLDTLKFTRTTPECRNDECGIHNWKFSPSGTVTFVYTDGCESGFHSKNKPSKKWMLKSSKNQIIFITNDGWKEIFEIVSLEENQLILVHRFDLEN